MKKRILLMLVVCLVAVLSVVSQPVYAQDQGAIRVSGSINYNFKVLAKGESSGNTFMDGTEDEAWTGGFEGTGVSPFPFVQWSSGAQDAWLITEFKGTVLGKYKGTLVMLGIYARPDATAHWEGEWMIVSGTGDLEHLRGHGLAWGPGSTNKDDGITDIYYTGEVMFLKPASN
jgi:Protein of unknown function (DUF3224)